MPLIDLRARISIDGIDPVRRGLDQVKRGFQEVKQEAEHAVTTLERFGHGLASVASGALGLGQRLAGAAAGFVALGTAASGAFGVFAFQTSVRFDSLERGLAGLTENAGTLRAELARLRETAKFPGLGFEEAAKGSLALQSVGLSALESEKDLRVFGNALALAGHGKAELDQLIAEFQHALGSDRFDERILRELTIRIPQARAALQSAFGTSDPEKLNQFGAVAVFRGLVSELEKLPRITGSISNDLENLADAIKNAVKPLGDGLIAAFRAAQPAINQFFGDVTQRLTQVGEVIAALGKSGIIGDILNKLLSAGEGLFGKNFQQGVAGFFANIAALVYNLPDVAAKFGKSIGEALGRVVSVGAYLSDAGNALARNIVEAFRYALDTTRSIVDGIGGAISALGKAFGDLLKVLTALPTDLLPPGIKAIIDGLQGWAGVAQLISPSFLNIALDKVAPPKFVGVPDPTGLLGRLGSPLSGLPTGTDAFAGAGAFYDRIMRSIGPLSDIPSGLNFGKNPGLPGNTVGQAGALDDWLAKIEKNTRQTADELSLRKQALGGGQLARLGITPAELARAGVSGNAPDKGSYGLPVAGTQLERTIRQMIQQEMAKGGGQPRFR